MTHQSHVVEPLTMATVGKESTGCFKEAVL